MQTLRDVALFLRALPLASVAQGVKTMPMPEIIERLGARGRGLEIDEAMRAAQRACSRWGRWFGGLDTCLTRSLVAGALLAYDHEVTLNIGFRPTDRGEKAVDGHAWLVVNGVPMELTGLDRENGEPYSETLELKMG